MKHFIAPVLVYLFSAEHKGSISKASHVRVWFLQHYWFLIKAECCFQMLCSSTHPSPLRLSQHQLGSIRNPDNSRWHMPAFITKPAVTRSLICVCAERFVCGEREGEEPLGIVFFCGRLIRTAVCLKEGKNFSTSAYLLQCFSSGWVVPVPASCLTSIWILKKLLIIVIHM